MLVSAPLAGASATAAAPQCMKGLVPALVAGGFSGSIDCKHDKLTVRYVGQVRKFGRTFSIYSNRYKLKPACPECAVHGGHRIIFMMRGHYLGQYRADFSDVTIRDGRLFLRAYLPHAKPVEVKLAANGPPQQQWDGDEVLQFFR